VRDDPRKLPSALMASRGVHRSRRLWADLVRPSITTVAQPTYDEGRHAAQLLVQRVTDPTAAPTKIVLTSTLHVRESSTHP